MLWLVLACVETPPVERAPPVVDVPPPTTFGPTAETGSLRPGTGDTGDSLGQNLIVNGGFEGDDGWQGRLGILASLAPAPERPGRALYVDDTGTDVSWTWSAPVEAESGQTYCLRADTWKQNTTNQGFTRVWVRFYGAPEAEVADALLLDPSFNVLDVDTSEQNRDGPEREWVTVEQTVLVPETVVVKALRVILTANATATGELFWDDVRLYGGGCPG